jgi:DNA-binding transcriptional regulator/RsmH inhibitor MraZ
VEASSNELKSGRPPLGIYTSRCDDKGRLRLPKEFEEFLRTFPEPEFFITTLDGSIARIYPIQTWMENEKVLAEYEEDPNAARDIAFLAHYFGGSSLIDAQGRVLVPPVLRRKLEIEDQKVNVRFYKGAVEVYSEAESERRLARATSALAANLVALEKKGLK